MTRKNRFISAIAIAAFGALMITTTAYQSKAANGVLGDNYHIDEGTGYAGAKIDNVTTESSGTFRYDAPGTGEDIKIVGSDITALASAVNALASQVMNVGDTAKAADMALDSSAAAAVDRLAESLSSSGGGGSSGGSIHGELLKTDWGYVNIDQSFVLKGTSIVDLFENTGYLGYGYGYGYTKNPSGVASNSVPTEVKDANYGVVHTTDGPSRYVVWQRTTSGKPSSEELKTETPIGRFAYAFNNNGTKGTSLNSNTAGSATINAYVIDNTGYTRQLIDYTSEQYWDNNYYSYRYRITHYYYIFAPIVD